jgi:hypothetical protein
MAKVVALSCLAALGNVLLDWQPREVDLRLHTDRKWGLFVAHWEEMN